MHDLQIVHSDLKAVNFLYSFFLQDRLTLVYKQNVLVSDDERALITDFGLSSIVATTALTPGGGTTRFMAPELLIGNGKITESCDIWSFACLCYEVYIILMLWFDS